MNSRAFLGLACNIRDELREEHSAASMEQYKELLHRFLAFFSLLDNRTEEQKQRVYQKLFSSNNRTVEQWLDFMEEFQNYAEPFSDISELDAIIATLGDEVSVVQDNEKVKVLAAYTLEAIQALGCNSTWCFSYPKSANHWYKYTTNDMVYYIFDKNHLMDQYVLVAPDALYSVDNMEVDLETLDYLGVDRSRLTFEPA